MVKLNGKQTRAHRVSLEIKLGRRLKGSEISMHLCNNPGCIEPQHLQLGTVSENNKMKRALQVTLADKNLKGWQDLY
jgi:hypothetical protein